MEHVRKSTQMSQDTLVPLAPPASKLMAAAAPHVSPPTGPHRLPDPVAPGPKPLEERPWRRSAREWDALRPVSFYARHLRYPMLYLFTLAMALPALLISLPLAMMNALIYGPRKVFFAQERVGYRGRIYVIYKFRTMLDVDGASDDARVTWFGRLLRNSHLDELPQLLNVLLGDMALVGPRPEMVSIEAWAGQALPAFSERLVLRPGLTGLAQITQGYALDGDQDAYGEKHEFNRAYLRSISFLGDLSILVQTLVWMLRRRGWSWSGKTS